MILLQHRICVNSIFAKRNLKCLDIFAFWFERKIDPSIIRKECWRRKLYSFRISNFRHTHTLGWL